MVVVIEINSGSEVHDEASHTRVLCQESTMEQPIQNVVSGIHDGMTHIICCVKDPWWGDPRKDVKDP